MGRALIEEVRRRYSARVSVLQGAASRRSPTDRFLRSFAARWEEAAELFLQTLASLSRGAARDGHDPRVKGRSSAGAESQASVSRRSASGGRLGLEESTAPRRAERRPPAGALPASARVSRDFQPPEESPALRRHGAAGEEGPIEGARGDSRSRSLPATASSARADFETAPPAPAEGRRARRMLGEGHRAPEAAEREASEVEHEAPVPSARDREEDLLRARRLPRPGLEAMESAEARAAVPGALDALGIPDPAKAEPPAGGSDSPAHGDFRRGPRGGEGAAPPAFPSALEELDREAAELERMEAFLDERKRFEEAVREWEGKGF